MATVGQIYHNLLDAETHTYLPGLEDIYTKNILPSGIRVTKLGIQAEPGTQIIIDESKNIMIGRSGIYELIDGVTLSELRFVQQKNYIKDSEATSEAIRRGSELMATAEDIRATAMAGLGTRPDELGPDPTEEEQQAYEAYWNRYYEIQNTYIQNYSAGLDEYQSGVNGIFKIDETDPDKKLYNVIVDYVYD